MIIGIDLGGTKALFALADDSGRIIKKISSPSGLYDGTCFDVLISGINQLIKDGNISLKDVKVIGIGAPDLTVPLKDKKAALRDVLKGFINRKTGIKTIVENDANAAALGEVEKGAGRDKKNMLYLIVGTGIGGAAVIDGKLYEGTTGRASEFGHMSVDVKGSKCGCGNSGCLHLYASGDSIAKRALKEIVARNSLDSKIVKLAGEFKDTKELIKKITAEIVFKAAKEGDPIAQDVIAQSLNYLGMALVSLINIYNPEVIVIGGGLASAGDMFFDPLNRIVKENIRKELYGEVKAVPSSLKEEGGLIGAVILAQRGLNR